MKQLNLYWIGKGGVTPSVPDGKTVTPTDDIQLWLKCAGINDKTYTTLAEVLADTTTLLALINSPNAVDYMVRSTTWAVSSALVPTMTSDTTPSGECFCTSVNTSNRPYLAFDGNDTSVAVMCSGDVSSSTPSWMGYKFDSPVSLSRAYVYQTSYTYNGCYIQSSSDGVTYTNISESFTLGKNGQEIVFPATADTYFRLYVGSVQEGTATARPIRTIQFYSASIANSATAMTLIGANNYCANTLLADSTWCEAILKSEYVKSVCNVYVPKMTSNTTPSGVASASSIFDSNFPAWKAFDGDETTRWAVTAGSSLNSYIQYKFTEPVKINWVTMISGLYNNQPRIIAYKISGSNDGVTFTDLKNFTTSADGQDIGKVLDNSTAYMYYRQTVTNYRENVNEPMLQFYGREDV